MSSISITSRVVFTICLMALLMLASLIPGQPRTGGSAFIWLVANIPTPVQKVLHVCFYGVFSLLLVWTLDAIQSRTDRFLISLFIAVAFGAVMEWCQTKVPGRYGTLYDVALNAAGASLGLLIAALIF